MKQNKDLLDAINGSLKRLGLGDVREALEGALQNNAVDSMETLSDVLAAALDAHYRVGTTFARNARSAIGFDQQIDADASETLADNPKRALLSQPDKVVEHESRPAMAVGKYFLVETTENRKRAQGATPTKPGDTSLSALDVALARFGDEDDVSSGLEDLGTGLFDSADGLVLSSNGPIVL